MSSDQSFFCESLEPRRLLTTLGTLDPSFSRDAQAYAAFGDTASAASVAVQSDGKVLIAGSIQNTHGIHFAVARFNADGSPDKTFGGGDGLLTFNPLTQIGAIDAGLSSATSIGVDSNGKILVAGFSSGVIAASTDPLGLRTFATVARLKTDGSFDNSYGNMGVAWTDFGQAASSEFDAMTVISGGAVVAVGVANGEAGVARFGSNGQLDTTFHTTGYNRFLFPQESDSQLLSVTLANDGSIYAAGIAGPDDGSSGNPSGEIDSSQSDIAIAKLNSAGNLDTSFGSGNIGRFSIDGARALAETNGGADIANSIFIDHTGTLVVGGSIETEVTLQSGGGRSARDNLAILRFSANGEPDAAWGKAGIQLFQFPNNGFPKIGAVAPYGTARYLLAGNDGSHLILEAVSSRTGKLDTTFGSKGLAGVNRNTTATAIAVAKDGSIFLAAGIKSDQLVGEGTQNLAGAIKLRGEAGAISGGVVNDANANGLKNTNDLPIAGVQLFLDFDSDGKHEANEPLATTNAGGLFTFTDVGPGTYKLRPILTGLRVTAPSAFRNVTVVSDKTTRSQNFLVTSRTLITGSVFRDDNGDGAFEPEDGEGVLDSWFVLIDLNNNGSPDAGEPQLLTDSNGNFAVPYLKAGTYHFIVQLPDLWKTTTPETLTFIVKSGQTVNGLTFGVEPI